MKTRLLLLLPLVLAAAAMAHAQEKTVAPDNVIETLEARLAKGEIKLGVKVSPANMAFYQQHKDALHAHQMALAKEQLAKNGGKLPACMTEQQ